MAIDKNKSQIEKISPDVGHTLLLNVFEISKLKKVKLASYDATVVMMSENIDLSLAVLILLKSLTVKNAYFCVENADQESIAQLFIKNTEWSIIRLDKQIARNLSYMITKAREN